MSHPPLAVTVSRTVGASPESLYALVADVARVGEHSHTFEPEEDGTRITESMWRRGAQPAPLRWMQRLAGVTDREDHLRVGMTATLARLDSAATAAVAS